MSNTSFESPITAAGGNCRILYPVHERDHWPREVNADQQITRVAVIDTETTGLSVERAEVIEFAAAMVAVDCDGKIVAIEGGGDCLIEPSKPLPRHIARLTGLTAANLKGRGINKAEATAFLSQADYVVAFNAAFDRPFVEQLLPDLSALNWACAMKDVDWRGADFEPGPQNYLLAQLGYFNPSAHRAMDDVQSLSTLLSCKLPDGATVVAHVLRTARARAYRFEFDLPLRRTEELRELRFQWSPINRRWHKYVPSYAFRHTYRAYREMFGRRPKITALQPSERHRGDELW